MGSKKGRRVRKIEVPTDSVPEFELGHSSRYPAEEGGGTTTATERGGKDGGIALTREGSCRKKAQDREK